MRAEPLLLLFFVTVAWAGPPQGGKGGANSSGSVGKYYFETEMQIGYPYMSLTNPDSSEANYDGVGLRLNASVPLYDGALTDLYLQAGVKYLDLQNTANSDSQFEDANIIGPGAGLALRISKFWIGAQYYQLWARHSATGKFSGRTNYNFQALDLFGGLHYEFGRMGVGLIYSTSSSTISHDSTGLQADTPYKDGMISLQITFSFGETLWNILGGLF